MARGASSPHASCLAPFLPYMDWRVGGIGDEGRTGIPTEVEIVVLEEEKCRAVLARKHRMSGVGMNDVPVILNVINVAGIEAQLVFRDHCPLDNSHVGVEQHGEYFNAREVIFQNVRGIITA